MPTILFRGTRVRYCDLRQKEEAGVFVRLHLTSDYSGPVCDHFTWPSDLDESITNCKLAGELPAVSMVLTPNDPALARHEIQLECRDLSDFQVVAMKEDGEVMGHELRYIARSGQAGAEALVGNWLRNIGSGTGNLTVTYAEQAEIEEQETAPDPQMDLCEDRPDSEDEDNGPLPSATIMAGNTDQLKKQRRQRQRPRAEGLEPSAEAVEPSARPIPSEPGPELRTADEIAHGVPLDQGDVN